MSDTSGENGPVREVLEFDYGVRVYPPSANVRYWRVRWVERRRARDTTARSRAAAIDKAAELVERLARNAPTDLAKARGADLVAHYLDPARRPPRVEAWSVRHRDEQARYCDRFVLPVIADLACGELTPADLQAVLDQAPTKSVAAQLRRTLSGLVNAGLDAGHLVARQDLLRGVRWHTNGSVARDPVDRAVTEDEIPTVDAVHRLAAVTAELTGVWWRELQILLVAYSGMRWGEHAALTAAQCDPHQRRLTINRQIVESRSALLIELPKSRRHRITMYPASTPAGIDLAGLLERRLSELADPDARLFPAQKGGLLRRSNYARIIWDPAAIEIGWPKKKTEDRWMWTFHSLRHVFATWALHDAKIPVEDVSKLLGHSSTRVTQDIYIHARDDLYQRFYDATAAPEE